MFFFSGMADYGFGEIDVFACHGFFASYNIFNLFFILIFFYLIFSK